MSGGGDTEIPDRTPIYVDSLPLRMCNVELHSLNRLCVVTSFQRVQYWTWEREGRVSLQWRSLRWWRSTSTVIKSSWSVSIPTQRDENGVLFRFGFALLFWVWVCGRTSYLYRNRHICKFSECKILKKRKRWWKIKIFIKLEKIRGLNWHVFSIFSI